MTYSILVVDPETKQFGAAAATGSLCVGGWVLRGKANVGLVASQGAAPSTFWRDDLLAAMERGEDVSAALNRIIMADAGHESRQLSALDSMGGSASFTGSKNTKIATARTFSNGIAAGNLLANNDVISAIIAGYHDSKGPMGERLLCALNAAQEVGGDSRGLLSSAMLIVSPHEAPIDLRIDYSKQPLKDLKSLYRRSMSGTYRDWHLTVPTLNNKEIGLD